MKENGTFTTDQQARFAVFAQEKLSDQTNLTIDLEHLLVKDLSEPNSQGIAFASRTYFAPTHGHHDEFSYYSNARDEIKFIQRDGKLWEPRSIVLRQGKDQPRVEVMFDTQGFGDNHDRSTLTLRANEGGHLYVHYDRATGKLAHMSLAKATEDQDNYRVHPKTGELLFDYMFDNIPASSDKVRPDRENVTFISNPVDGLSDLVTLPRRINISKTIFSMIPPKYLVNPDSPTPEEDAVWRNMDWREVFGITYQKDIAAGIKPPEGFYLPNGSKAPHFLDRGNIPNYIRNTKNRY